LVLSTDARLDIIGAATTNTGAAAR